VIPDLALADGVELLAATSGEGEFSRF